MNRFFTLFMALFIAAGAQAATNLNLREFRVINDVSFDSDHREIFWYQGESVRYEVTVKRGNELIYYPTNTYPVWKAWLEADPTNLYINVTGTLVDVSGTVRVDLTPSQANLPTGVYLSALQLWDGVNYMGLAGESDLRVQYSPAGANISYVGTSPAIGFNFGGEEFAVKDADSSAAVQLSATGGLAQVIYRDETGTVYGLGFTAGQLVFGTGGDILTTNQTVLTTEGDPLAVLADGSRAMSGDLNMGGNAITNVSTNSIVFTDGTTLPQALNSLESALNTASNALTAANTADVTAVTLALNAASNSLRAGVNTNAALITALTNGFTAKDTAILSGLATASNALNTGVTGNVADISANLARITAVSNTLRGTAVDLSNGVASVVTDLNTASNYLYTFVITNRAAIGTASNALLIAYQAGDTSVAAQVAAASNALRTTASANSLNIGGLSNALGTASNALNTGITAARSAGTTLSNYLGTVSNSLYGYTTGNLARINAASNALFVSVSGNTARINAASNGLVTLAGGMGDSLTNNRTALNTASNALNLGITQNLARINTASNALNTATTAARAAGDAASNALQAAKLSLSGGLMTGALSLTNYSPITFAEQPAAAPSNTLRWLFQGGQYMSLGADGGGLFQASGVTTSYLSQLPAVNAVSNGLTTSIGGTGASLTNTITALNTASNSLRSGITNAFEPGDNLNDGTNLSINLAARELVGITTGETVILDYSTNVFIPNGVTLTIGGQTHTNVLSGSLAGNETDPFAVRTNNNVTVLVNNAGYISTNAPDPWYWDQIATGSIDIVGNVISNVGLLINDKAGLNLNTRELYNSGGNQVLDFNTGFSVSGTPVNVINADILLKQNPTNELFTYISSNIYTKGDITGATISAASGNFGNLTATNVTYTAGLLVTNGNLTVSNGDLRVAGSLSVTSGIVGGGDLVITNGDWYVYGQHKTMAMGEIHISFTNAAPTPVTQNVFTAVQGTGAIGNVSMWTTYSNNGINQLVFTNTWPLMCHMGATISLSSDQNNDQVSLMAFRNGSQVNESRVFLRIPTSGKSSTALHWMNANVATNDAFDIRVTSTNASSTITVESMNLFGMCM